MKPRNVYGILAVALLALLLCSCDGLPVLEPPRRASTPAWPTPANPLPPDTPQAAATAAPVEEPPEVAQPSPTASPSPPAALVAPEPTETPTAEQNGMVFARGNDLFWLDVASGEILPVAALSSLDVWAYAQGQLALARHRYIDVYELATGQVTAMDAGLSVGASDLQLLWGSDGLSLLLGSTTPGADGGLNSTLSVLEPGTRETRLVVEAAGVAMIKLLTHDVPGGTASWVVAEDDQAGQTVQTVDLATGAILSSSDAGDGEVLLSPDGSLLLSQRMSEAGQSLWVARLGADGEAAAEEYAHAANAISVSHAWSQNGAMVAYLLWQGQPGGDDMAPGGLWVLDIATMTSQLVVEDVPLAAEIAGWTPDGDSIIVLRNDGDVGGSFLVRTDGGGYRELALDHQTVVLGWMQRPNVPADAPGLDAWRARFVASADADALAAVASDYVMANPGTETEALQSQLDAYASAAGWPNAASRVVSLGEHLAVGQFAGVRVLVIENGKAQALGAGRLVEARLEEDLLALILEMDIAGATQSTVSVWERGDQQWQLVWQPVGRRDWITTNGEVSFIGEGIGQLSTTGASLGLPAWAFVECSDCPQRELRGTWVLDAEGAYERETVLEQGASLDQVYWEMTTRSFYAVLYEAVRRAALGEDASAVSTDDALAAIAALGLDAKDTRLMVSVDGDEIAFGSPDEPNAYLAAFGDGLLLSVTPR